MQFVFGNPTKGKKKMAKRKRSARKKSVKRRRNPVTKTVTARKKVGTTLKGKSILSKKRTKVASRTVLSKTEIGKMRKAAAGVSATIAQLSDLSSIAKGAKKKTLTARLKKRRATLRKLKGIIAKKKKDRTSAADYLRMMAKAAKEDGALAVKIEKEFKNVPGVTMAKKKKKKKTVRRKKKATKKRRKSAAKKKTASKKRRKKVVRKTAKKKTRRKSTRRRTKKKVTKTTGSLRVGKKRTSAKISGATKKLRKKGSSVRKKFRRGRKKYSASIRRTNPKRRNPVLGQNIFSQFKALGPMAGQMSALMFGGAFYGYSNQLMSKYARPVYDAFQAVPVVGPTLPNLLLGIGMTMASKKVKQKMASEVLMTIGQGMIGSAAVGIGVNASQYVPFLSGGGMSGVQYTPMGNVSFIPGGGRSVAGSSSSGDFAAIPSGLGNVDFTPEMGSVDFTPEMGEYKQSASDYGFETPEGMF